ncbi:MAG: hypothetical protein JKY56_07265 [Kofleriaceae bacterium]|nr:hypothetical protein [Kofleriaceae bacterium]
MNRTALGAIVIATLILGQLFGQSVALADSPRVCGPTDSIDKYRLLRQLSLDLRGTIPTVAEYEALHEQTDVSADVLEAMLSSDAYFTQVRGYHRSLIWAGLEDGMSIVTNRRRLASAGNRPYRIKQLRRRYRGRSDIECFNREQIEFDAEGRPIPMEVTVDSTCRRNECRREGYVRIAPYWAPDTSIKICAYDAQDYELDLNGNRCGVFNTNPGCGCGQDLRNCLPTGGTEAHSRVRDALAEESTRIFEATIRAGKSYFDAFTTRTTYVNGLLSHFYRYLSGEVALELANGRAYDHQIDNIPVLAFDDPAWVPVERNSVHSGVLTTPGFHLRFTSNRARTNRFYSAFRCEPFVSSEGLPAEMSATPNPNLRERPGCAACHQSLERAAAHWGRWRTDGEFGFFDEPSMDFSAQREDCQRCTGSECSSFCDSYFITANNSSHPDELSQWQGYPRARAWLSEGEAGAIETGPSGLVTAQTDRDTIATCTVRNLAQHLLNRELSEDELLVWVPSLTSQFAESGYNFQSLTRNLVTDERYRTIR